MALLVFPVGWQQIYLEKPCAESFPTHTLLPSCIFGVLSLAVECALIVDEIISNYVNNPCDTTSDCQESHDNELRDEQE